jgi:hypothetical protein
MWPSAGGGAAHHVGGVAFFFGSTSRRTAAVCTWVGCGCGCGWSCAGGSVVGCGRSCVAAWARVDGGGVGVRVRPRVVGWEVGGDDGIRAAGCCWTMWPCGRCSPASAPPVDEGRFLSSSVVLGCCGPRSGASRAAAVRAADGRCGCGPAVPGLVVAGHAGVCAVACGGLTGVVLCCGVGMWPSAGGGAAHHGRGVAFFFGSTSRRTAAARTWVGCGCGCGWSCAGGSWWWWWGAGGVAWRRGRAWMVAAWVCVSVRGWWVGRWAATTAFGRRGVAGPCGRVGGVRPPVHHRSTRAGSFPRRSSLAAAVPGRVHHGQRQSGPPMGGVVVAPPCLVWWWRAMRGCAPWRAVG